jgi:hypothetical protein
VKGFSRLRRDEAVAAFLVGVDGRLAHGRCGKQQNGNKGFHLKKLIEEIIIW